MESSEQHSPEREPSLASLMSEVDGLTDEWCSCIDGLYADAQQWRTLLAVMAGLAAPPR